MCASDPGLVAVDSPYGDPDGKRRLPVHVSRERQGPGLVAAIDEDKECVGSSADLHAWQRLSPNPLNAHNRLWL